MCVRARARERACERRSVQERQWACTHTPAEHIVLGGVPCRVVVLADGGSRARPKERTSERRRW